MQTVINNFRPKTINILELTVIQTVIVISISLVGLA